MTTLAIEYFLSTGQRSRLGRIYNTRFETFRAIGPYGTNSISSQKGCCAVSRSGEYIAIAGAATVAENPEVRVVRVSDGVTVHQYNTPAGWVGALAFSADDSHLFMLRRNVNLFRMNLSSGAVVQVAGSRTNITGMALSQFTSGQNVLALYQLGKSVLLDADSFEDLGLVSDTNVTNADASMALSPGGKFLCALPAAGLYPFAFVYSMFEKELVADISSLASAFLDSTFSKDDRYLLIATGFTGLLVVDTATWDVETVVAPGVHISSVCMSPDFSKAFVWSGTGSAQQLAVVDMATWAISYPSWASSPGSAAVVSMLRSPNGVHRRMSPTDKPFWDSLLGTYEDVV